MMQILYMIVNLLSREKFLICWKNGMRFFGNEGGEECWMVYYYCRRGCGVLEKVKFQFKL